MTFHWGTDLGDLASPEEIGRYHYIAQLRFFGIMLGSIMLGVTTQYKVLEYVP